MTDQQTHYNSVGEPLITIDREDETLAKDLMIKLPILDQDHWIRVPARRLLELIDAAAPDAMRAYLRETVEHTYLENMGVPATKPEIPEADSPEDVDEHPDPVEQMRESGRQLGEAWRALSDAFREASKGSNR